VEILVLLGTIVALIRLIWPHNRAAALALAPYGAWVAFATALTWTIAARN
jgi:tryptophan-rich sensory protein